MPRFKNISDRTQKPSFGDVLHILEPGQVTEIPEALTHLLALRKVTYLEACDGPVTATRRARLHPAQSALLARFSARQIEEFHARWCEADDAARDALIVDLQRFAARPPSALARRDEELERDDDESEGAAPADAPPEAATDESIQRQIGNAAATVGRTRRPRRVEG